MKKLLAILTLTAFVCTTAFSQVQINPKIGYNIYDVSDEEGVFEADGQSGFNVGVDFRIGDAIYVQPGIHYYALNVDFEGIAEDDDDLQDLVVDDVRRQTLRIPVVVGTSFFNSDNFGLRAFVGGAAFVPFDVDENNVFGISKEDYRPVNFGATVGVGLDLKRVTIDASYDFGLTDSIDDDSTLDYNNKPNVFSITLGYLF